MRSAAIVLAFAAVLCAQPPAPSPAPAAAPLANEAAVSGIVRDKGTGRPLARYIVSTDIRSTSPPRNIESITDESGSYRLSGLPAGNYQITAVASERGGRSRITRSIALAGHNLADINFDVVVPATIKGKVVDENQEPVPHVAVMLVAREYFLGRSIYALQGFAGRTNDRGEYSIANVDAGRPYLVLADMESSRLPAHADTPLNPKLRRRVHMRTWYPNAPSADGAIEIVLRPSEVREAVDIEMKKSASYCAEGKTTAGGAPASLYFALEAQQPSNGVSANKGTFRSSPSGQTGSDGQFRICDLYPGMWRLTATNLGDDSNAPVFGTTTFSIGDQDVRDVNLNAMPGGSLEGEVVLDGPAPNNPLSANVLFSLQPLMRAPYRSEFGRNSPRPDIPGTFSIPSVVTDDYAVRAFVRAPGLYIKDVTYGGISVLYSPLRIGSTVSNPTLRIIVGQDGATLSAVVTGKDGTPVPDTNIVIVPANNVSEAAMAADMVTGKTDQNGQYKSQTLAPGKYYIAATDHAYDASVASIKQLWESHLKFTDVTLASNGTGQVTLQPLH